ncbi:30S ribosomal protein S4 [Candidatus Dojkabacteria bacterium]|nr:30S ribosomal protein S4 [Candidatus Dojkabacteria bacterium]
MARYTGPKWKISRREGASVYGDEKWKKRPTLPGQHPTSMKRPSNYAIQLREKQKVKRMYGLLEKQFRGVYQKATAATGNTGTRLLQLLEMRLDNVVYRLGFAKTRNQARQMVTHAHVKVNDKKVNIPSYIVKVGDQIMIKGAEKKDNCVALIKLETKNAKVPLWLSRVSEGGEIKSVPTREMMDPTIKEQLIVEFYSR